MSAVTNPLVRQPAGWILPDRGKVAMACLIVAESAIFTIFVVAYLYYLGKSVAGPTPSQVLQTPIFYSACLLFSSFTIHRAGNLLQRGRRDRFLAWWVLTIVLGGLFLYGTGQEWHRLIYEHGLTISTNLFGTTYYSLVGLHASHLVAGLTMLMIVLYFGVTGRVTEDHSPRIEVLSMYWHFVDAVWVVVFMIVYVIGR